MARRATRVFGVFVGVMAIALVGGLAWAGSQSAAATLNMNAGLRLVSILGPCPPGVSATGCAERTSTGPFAGLGQVIGRYTFLIDVGPPGCANGWGKARAYPVRFAIASKGEIQFELAAGAQCLNEDLELAARAQTQAFTVTGGTGIYAGASGTGIVSRFSQRRAPGPQGPRRGPARSPCRASNSMSRSRHSRERPTRRCEPRSVRSRPVSSSR